MQVRSKVALAGVGVASALWATDATMSASASGLSGFDDPKPRDVHAAPAAPTAVQAIPALAGLAQLVAAAAPVWGPALASVARQAGTINGLSGK